MSLQTRQTAIGEDAIEAVREAVHTISHLTGGGCDPRPLLWAALAFETLAPFEDVISTEEKHELLRELTAAGSFAVANKTDEIETRLMSRLPADVQDVLQKSNVKQTRH